MIGKLDCNVCREMCFRDLVSSLRWSSFNDVFPLWRLCGSTRRRMWQWLWSVARSSCLQLELTTPYGLNCMHSGTSWVCLCIVSSVLLCPDGQKIVRKYKMIFGKRWFSILETCPAFRSWFCINMAAILGVPACCRTMMFVTKSLQMMFRMVLRQHWWKRSRCRCGCSMSPRM